MLWGLLPPLVDSGNWGKSNVSSQGVCVVNLCLLLNDAHLYANCSGVGEGVKADPGSL